MGVAKPPWFNARSQPPVNGDEDIVYEVRCTGALSQGLVHKVGGDFVSRLGRLCPHCEWRGLTKPAEQEARKP